MSRFLSRTIIFSVSLSILTMALPAIAATIGSSNSASYKQNTGINRDLIAWWTFDGADVTATQVLDKSVSNYHLTRNSSLLPASGKIGQALKMNSPTAYLQSTSFAFASNTSTISFWANCATGSGSSYKAVFVKFAGSNSRVDIGFAPACTTIWPVFSNETGNTGGALYTSSITANHWHLYTFVVDALTIKFYIDGVLQKDITYSAVLTGIAANLNIGTRGGTDYYWGSLDDIRIYNRALAASEIKQLYNMGTGRINSSITPEKTTLGINSGLVGYWTMDGADVSGTNVLDKSGQGNNGTSVGAKKTMGKIGQAMSFNGSGKYISPFSSSRFVTVANIFATGLTYGAWVKTAAVTHQGIVGQSASVGYSYFSAGGLKLDSDGFLQMIAYDTGDNYYAAISVVKVNNNAWHYVAGTFNPSDKKFRVYVDGVFSGISSHAFTTMTEANYAVIGAVLKDNDPQYFNGNIDDVRVYNRALSAAEVKQLYAMSAGSQTNASITPEKTTLGINSGLVGYWTMDGADVIGTAVYDKSGSGNNGTSSGGVTKTMGKIGQAMKFNGVNGRITATGYETATFTLSAWVKTNDATEDKWFVEMTDSSGNRHGIGMYPAGRPVITYGVLKWKNSTGPLINDSKWHYFVGTYNGTGAKIYIDGVSQSLSAENTTGTKTASTLTIGSTATGDYINSLIDDVRIYSRALSLAEIQQLYQMGK